MKEKIFLTLFLIHVLSIKEALFQTIAPLTTTPSASAVEISSIALVKPEDCIYPTQYFDIARLNCLNCPPNSSATENSKK